MSFLHLGRGGGTGYNYDISFFPDFATGEGVPVIVKTIGKPASIPESILVRAEQEVAAGKYVYAPEGAVMQYYEGQMGKGKLFYPIRSEATTRPFGVSGSHELEFNLLGSPRFVKTSQGYVRVRETAPFIAKEGSYSEFVDVRTGQKYAAEETISVGGMVRLPQDYYPTTAAKAQLAQIKGYREVVVLPKEFATRVNRQVVVPSVLYEPVILKNVPPVGGVLSESEFASLRLNARTGVTGRSVFQQSGGVAKNVDLISFNEYQTRQEASVQSISRLGESGRQRLSMPQYSFPSGATPGVTSSLFAYVQPSYEPPYRVMVSRSVVPSVSQSVYPSIVPSIVPSVSPSAVPSVSSSRVPSISISYVPSVVPSPSPSIVPSNVPSFIPGFVPNLPPPTWVRTRKEGEGKRKKSYKVQIKRRGKFVNIGGELPFGRALEFGSKKTRESLAATFRLKEAGTTELSDVQYPVSTKFFRSYAVKKGQRIDLPLTFIQRRGTRLGTSGEVSEITAAKISKRRTNALMGGIFSV